MGLFKRVKNITEKADKAMDSAQEALNSSSKGIQTVIDILSVALIVSICTNVVTIGINLINAKHGRMPKSQIVIHNLYLGGKSGEK